MARRSGARRVAGYLAAVGVLAAGAVTASGGAVAAVAGIGWHGCTDPAAARYHARCGTLSVPLDRSHPGGARINLALLRVPATDHRTGTVVADSEDLAGFGGSQISFFLRHGDNYLSRLRRTHAGKDIVVFDPRGLGGSAAVSCAGSGHDPHVTTFPTTPADDAALRSHNATVAAGCHTAAGAPAHLGPADQVRDVEDLRAVLGADRLDWMGQAYGAALGADYAARYPNRVGRMVLDVPVDPYRPAAARALDAATAEETAFGHFTAWCRATPARCALGDPGAVLDRAAARADAGGVRGAAPVDRPLTGTEIRTAVGQFMLGYPVTWPALAAALGRAATGDGSGLAPFVAMPFTEPDYTASRWQSCTDRDSPDRATLAALVRRARAAASHTGGASLAWDALAGCAGWPGAHQAPAPHATAAARTAPLVTATTGDPITPSGWARDVAHRLPGARLLTAGVDGHGALDNSTCAAAAIDGYLTGDRVPPEPPTCTT